MNGRLLFAIVMSLMLSTIGVYAATTSDVEVTDVGVPGQVTTSAQGNVAAQGGNTTNVNLTSNSNTAKWQGFYGDITGSLRLGDGASILYDFGLSSFQAVFASSNDSVNFVTVTGLGLAAAQGAADVDFGWASDLDNITNVVDDVAGCTAGTEIVAAGAITTLNSTGGDWSADTCFAGTVAAPITVDDYIWGTDIVAAGEASFITGFDVEYQLMVPVNGVSDLFYFYLEI